MTVELVLSHALAQYRKDYKISKRRHAEILGVDRSNYNRYCSGKKFPSSPVLNRMLSNGLTISFGVDKVVNSDKLNTYATARSNKRDFWVALPLLSKGNKGVKHENKGKYNNSTASLT